MIAAIAMTMQKYEGTKTSTFTRLSVIYDAMSLDEAVGKTVSEATKEFNEYQIASIAKIEVTPPKEDVEETAELRTTAAAAQL